VDDVCVDAPLAEIVQRTVEQVERAAILRALEQAGGSLSAAADRLTIDRATLHRKMKKYGVSPPRGKTNRQPVRVSAP
jgi:transcriptional regulator of acetoin/glycerol metabolism